MLTFVLLIAIRAFYSLEANKYDDKEFRNTRSLKEGFMCGSGKCTASVVNLEATKAIFLFPSPLKSRPLEYAHLYITGLGRSGMCSISSPVHHTPDIVNVMGNFTVPYFMDKYDIHHANEGYNNKGVLVDCNVPVRIDGFTQSLIKSGAFTVLPISALGREYVIPGFYTGIMDSHTWFGLTTLVNNTNVSIKVRGVIVFDGSSHNNGETFNITLAPLQTALMLCGQCDLSGTFVSSSEPIAVISGVTEANYILGTPLGHQMLEMIVPVDSYAKVFAIPFYPSSLFNGLIRIFAYQDTSVKIHSYYAPRSRHLHSKGFMNENYGSTSFIESISPVMVQLYGYECNNVPISDAFMMTVPGIDQYKSSYVFNLDNFSNFVVSFVVKLEDKEGIRLNGKVVDMSNKRIYALNGTDYVSFYVTVQLNYHVVEHTLGARFGVFVIQLEDRSCSGFTPL